MDTPTNPHTAHPLDCCQPHAFGSGISPGPAKTARACCCCCTITPAATPHPRPRDIAATRQLVEAGKIIGIEVLDHVVLGRRTPSRPRDWLSFRQENLL